MNTMLAPDNTSLFGGMVDYSQENTVLEALRTAGFQESNGWFYPPSGEDRAAVRISVFEGQYQVWRRRKLTSPWMIIVTADADEFDFKNFRAWYATWPLTH